jgi:AcrR family transcriptional regulator
MTDHQRRRVLNAAVEVFSRKGYPSTTVDDLVEAAGMGVGSFYALFEGKEGCLLAAYDEIIQEVRQAVDEGRDAPTWPQQVCASLRGLLTWVAAEPLRARVALIEIQTAGPPALLRYETTLEEAAATLAEGRGLAPGVSLPDSLERTTVSGVAWLLHRRVALGESEDVPDLYEELAQLILEPYLGEQKALEIVKNGNVLVSS